MDLSIELFEGVIEWLRKNYHKYTFYTERDIVWIIQTSMARIIKKKNLPLRVFHDYGLLQTNRRKNYIDLVVLDNDDSINLAAEFSYEPSHKRIDILPEKFPVVTWDKDGIKADVEHAREYIQKDIAGVAYSVFIDEGGQFRKRNPLPDTEWIDWDPPDTQSRPVSILWFKVEKQERDKK